MSAAAPRATARFAHRASVWSDALRFNLPYWWVMAWNIVLWITGPGHPFRERPHPVGLEQLEQHWLEIRAELDAVLADRRPVGRLQDVDPGQRRLSDDDLWHVFVLRFYGVDVAEGRARCPRTAELLDDVAGVETAMFSIFGAGKETGWHAGGVKGVLRYHLGIKVPDPQRCGIELRPGGTHHWREGEGVLLDDTYPHRAWNHSDDVRVVLWLDLERPLRWSWLQRANRRVLDRLAASGRIVDAAARAGTVEA